MDLPGKYRAPASVLPWAALPERHFATPGPYHIVTDVLGREHDTFPAASRVETVIRLIAAEQAEAVLQLRGVFAARLALLLRDYPPGSSLFSAARFNCFCTTELLQGHRQSYRWVEWMRERGERREPTDVFQEEVRLMLFQLCGRHLAGFEPDHIEPLHEAFVLGRHEHEVVVLEKPAHQPLRTNHWSALWAEWQAESTVELTHVNWLPLPYLLDR